MEHFRRSDRLPVIMEKLAASPNQTLTLNKLCESFDAAKSTLSEDVGILQKMMKRFGMGEISTAVGASGGVRFRPGISQEEKQSFLLALCEELQKPSRILPGGFLYLSDILSNPEIVQKMALIIAMAFYDVNPDFVLTMETKGIPVALMTAQKLGVPLIVARHTSKVYEGPAVNINYISGPAGRIETMSLNRRSVSAGQKALIVDDFLRGGGTAKGMMDLMTEFSAEVVGTAFVMAAKNAVNRQISDEKVLMEMELSENNSLTIRPTPWAMA